MKFGCTKCGACCRIAGLTGKVPNRGDGGCVYLGEDNECLIYENRPEVCRVDSMYEKYKEEGLDMSREEYYDLAGKSCNNLMDNLGIDESFRIK